MRAQAYLKLSKWRKVIADATKAIKLNPKQPGNYHLRGSAYLRCSRLEKAIDDFNMLVKLDPSNKEMKNYLVTLQKYKEDMDLYDAQFSDMSSTNRDIEY